MLLLTPKPQSIKSIKVYFEPFSRRRTWNCATKEKEDEKKRRLVQTEQIVFCSFWYICYNRELYDRSIRVLPMSRNCVSLDPKPCNRWPMSPLPVPVSDPVLIMQIRGNPFQKGWADDRTEQKKERKLNKVTSCHEKFLIPFLTNWASQDVPAPGFSSAPRPN